MTTPDFLRGAATAQIVGLMQNIHQGGTWALDRVITYGGRSTLEFKVGIINPDTLVDDRQTVRITVEEVTS